MPIECSRRAIVRGAIALAGASACGSRGWTAPAQWYIGIIPDEPYDIRIVDKLRIPAAFHRQVVPFRGPEPPGTLVVVRGDRFLYAVKPRGRALRFGISVGRQGMEWQGEAVVGRKARWPTWTPTPNMRARPVAAGQCSWRSSQSTRSAGSLPFPGWERHALSHPRHQPTVEHR